MRERTGPLAAALCALTLACTGCGGALTTGLHVSGNRLLLDGRPFEIHGLQIVGIVAPKTALRGQYLAASQHFGPAEIQAARAWGANTIRFQLSQPGLDPSSTLYSAAYVAKVQSAVRLARNDGLAVILSLQDQTPSGQTNPWPMPTEATARAWGVLAPLFGRDPGVAFELFNEPELPPSATDWRLWAQGGTVAPFREHAAFTAVGAQALIDQIRATGASNVILVDGLDWAVSLAGQPALRDPDHQIAYAVHPYFGGWMKPDAETAWNQDFGDAATREPVVVTEWYVASNQSGCKTDWPTAATQFIGYLRGHHIGLVGFAFDVPGTVIANWSYAPTTYTDFTCGTQGGGPGALIYAWYHDGS